MAARSVVPSAGQIWFLKEPRLGNALHGHYALVTRVDPIRNLARINFIATDARSYNDFRIDAESEDFKTTGLEHTSHLLIDEANAIPLRVLLAGKYAGFISGEMKERIEDWWGDSI